MIRYIKENNEDIIEMPLECIKGATLLSKKEYKKYKNNIFYIDALWWLRSPGYNGNACGVYYDGDISNELYAWDPRGDIRPALILNLQSSNIEIGNGDKFDFGGHRFTILSDDLAICDDFIGNGCFREDQDAKDSNIYKKSDVKKVIDKWFKDACFDFEFNSTKEFGEFDFGF